MPPKAANPQSPTKSRSRSPVDKRTALQRSDDAIIDARVAANKIDTPTTLFRVFAAVISILPAYIAFIIMDVPFVIVNLAVAAVTAAFAAYALSNGYAILFRCEFQKRDVPYSEIKAQKDANLLRSLRLELAIAVAIMWVNGFFVAITSALQLYVLKQAPPLVAFIVGSSAAALVAWMVAYKSEEARKKSEKKD